MLRSKVWIHQRSPKERIPVDGMIDIMTNYLKLCEYFTPSDQALAVTKGLNFLGMGSLKELRFKRAYTFYTNRQDQSNT